MERSFELYGNRRPYIVGDFQLQWISTSRPMNVPDEWTVEFEVSNQNVKIGSIVVRNGNSTTFRPVNNSELYAWRFFDLREVCIEAERIAEDRAVKPRE